MSEGECAAQIELLLLLNEQENNLFNDCAGVFLTSFMLTVS